VLDDDRVQAVEELLHAVDVLRGGLGQPRGPLAHCDVVVDHWRGRLWMPEHSPDALVEPQLLRPRVWEEDVLDERHHPVAAVGALGRRQARQLARNRHHLVEPARQRLVLVRDRLRLERGHGTPPMSTSMMLPAGGNWGTSGYSAPIRACADVGACAARDDASVTRAALALAALGSVLAGAFSTSSGTIPSATPRGPRRWR
jgi:hypothetical protein